MIRLLFITWDGPGTTYHETLFIPLLRRSLPSGSVLELLQFGWGDDERACRLRGMAEVQGFRFDHRKLHRGRRVWRTPFAILRALLSLTRRCRDGTYDIIMARSAIPAVLALLTRCVARREVSLIFDADGLPADEGVEFGGWRPNGLRYRLFLWLEYLAVRRADVVLARTPQAVEVLRQRSGRNDDRFVVVTNGKDEDVYRPVSVDQRRETRAALEIPTEAAVMVYVGSIGPQYELNFMFDVLRHALTEHPQTYLLFLTQTQHHDAVRAACDERLSGNLVLLDAKPDGVPSLLAAADAGLAFRRPSFSQTAVSPIKVAEYLLCGLPVAYTAGVGNLDAQLDWPVGIAVNNTTEAATAVVVQWLFNDILPNCELVTELARRLGEERYSLATGAQGYMAALEVVLGHR